MFKVRHFFIFLMICIQCTPAFSMQSDRERQIDLFAGGGVNLKDIRFISYNNDGSFGIFSFVGPVQTVYINASGEYRVKVISKGTVINDFSISFDEYSEVVELYKKMQGM